MIFEGVISTRNADASAHVTPMGFEREGGRVVIAPFVPSQTLDNLAGNGAAVMNLTDDVGVIAGCLTGRRDWPVVAANVITGWRLATVLTHLEVMVERRSGTPERPRFECNIVHEACHAPFRGYNRAQAAVVEAAILISRLDWIAPEKFAAEMTYLSIAVTKTGGPREREAWQWLLDAAAAHPRHRFQLDVTV